MTRHRFAVALLPPEPLSVQLDGLRRVVGDRRVDVLPIHLTIVPPVNLRGDAVPELRRLLRRVASATRPFELELGPAASFAPATPTVHLSVRGDVDAVTALRNLLKVGLLERPDEWPFVPHVTLRESVPARQVDDALGVLSGSLGTWSVDRLHLLEHVTDEPGDAPSPDESTTDDQEGAGIGAGGRSGTIRRWRAVVEEPFGGSDVVGRGGIELVLRTVEMVEPEVTDLLRGDESPQPPHRTDRGVRTLVVVAELPGRIGEPVAAIIGSVAGSAARVSALHVADPHQGLGIGRQVASQWCVAAARRGAIVAIADDRVGEGALRAWGFSPFGGRLMRQLHTGEDE